MNTPIKLYEPRIFRTTPGVRFHDITIANSNGLDLVEHEGTSVSPPPADKALFYRHSFQIDNNRVLAGQRLFELFCDDWERKHWFVFLDENSGALEIPAGCYHRSYSGLEGSLLINQAIRLDGYDESKEFIPVECPAIGKHTVAFHGITPASVHSFIHQGVLL